MKPEKTTITKSKLRKIERAFKEYKTGAFKELPPEGWFTKLDYAHAHNVSQSTAERHINRLIYLKKIKIRSYSHRRIDGTYIKIPHYFLIQP